MACSSSAEDAEPQPLAIGSDRCTGGAPADGAVVFLGSGSDWTGEERATARVNKAFDDANHQ